MFSSKEFSAAISEHYRLYAPRLLAYARGHTNSAQDSEDAVQEVYRRLYERGSLEGLDNEGGFAMGILKNVLRTEDRIRSRSCAMSFEDSEKYHLPVPAAEAVFLEQEKREAIRDSVGAIASPQARALLRGRAYDLKPRQLAELDLPELGGKSRKQIRHALYNAQNALRQQFQKRGISAEKTLTAWLWKLRSWLKPEGSSAFLPIAEAPGALLQSLGSLSAAGIFIAWQMLSPGAVSEAGNPPILGYSAPNEDHYRAMGLVFVESIQKQNEIPSGPPPADPGPSSSDRKAQYSALRQDSALSKVDEPNGSGSAQPPPARFAPQPPENVRLEPPGGGSIQSEHRTEKNKDEPAPSLPDQTFELVQRPEEIPLPTCWGVAVCDELPKHL